MGRTSRDPGFQRLAERIRRSGFEVIERASSPIGAHSSVKDADELLEGVDLAVLAVRKTDDIASFGTVKPFQRLSRDAGLLQGKLGMERVILMVESDVEGLSNDLGLPVVRFPAGQPEMAEAELKKRLADIAPQPTSGVHSRLASVEARRSDRLLWPLLLVLAVGFVAMVAALAVLLSWSSDEPETAQVIDVSPHLRPGFVADGSGGGGQSEFGTAAPAAPGAPVPNPPAGPGALDPQADQRFPVECQIALPKDDLDQEIRCTDTGVVALTGVLGSWHNDLVAVVLDDGVAGVVTYERDGSELVLGPGITYLDRDLAAYGVERVTFTFGAEGQHAHLVGDGGAGDEANLVFRLDG